MASLEKLIDFFEANEEQLTQLWIVECKKDEIILAQNCCDKFTQNGVSLLIAFAKNGPESVAQWFKGNISIKLDYTDKRQLSICMKCISLGRNVIGKAIIESGHFEDPSKALNKVNEFFEAYSMLKINLYEAELKHELEDKHRELNASHQERLTLLGKMSSSFVHEFRNPLTSIIGFVKILKSDYPDLPYLTFILHEAEQLNDRITQFLTLSKKEVISPEHEVFDPKQLIEEVKDFVYPAVIDADIYVDGDSEGDSFLYMSKTELRQVLINIFMNAVEAMRFEPIRNITLSYNETESEVLFSIRNTGPRIEEEVISKIFEPFYTTKEVGTGIGLYVCREIIDKYKGQIHCESNEFYTTFTVQLPKSDVLCPV